MSAPPSAAPDSRRRSRLALAAAALGSLALLSGSGCNGGTSSGADNPDIDIGFRLDGKPFAFRGQVQFYTQGADPVFYNPPPDDGSPTSVGVEIEYGQPTTFALKGDSSVTIPGELLAKLVDSRPVLPLYTVSNVTGLAFPQAAPGGSAPGSRPPFNLILSSFDSLAAMVEGVRADADGRYLDSAGNRLDTLWVDLKRTSAFSGTLDTAGLGSAPLAVFVPGSPFYAPVRGNRFVFPFVPRSPLPARLALANGFIHSLPKTLDGSSFSLDSGVVTNPLAWKPGPKINSIEVPVPTYTLKEPDASPSGEYRFTDSLRVALSAEAGAAIRYTVDGSEPGVQSQAYSNPLLLRSSATVKAVAFRRGSNRSAVSTNNYVLVPPKPTVSQGSGVFSDSLVIVLGTFAKNGSVVYTLDGSNPASASTRYSNPITIKSNVTLKAATYVPGLGLSDVVERQYVRAPDSQYVVPAVPQADPKGGSYSDTVTITLSTATPQAELYYTLDGTLPNASSQRYSAPVRIVQSTTLSVVAILNGVISPVLQESYNVALQSH